MSSVRTLAGVAMNANAPFLDFQTEDSAHSAESLASSGVPLHGEATPWKKKVVSDFSRSLKLEFALSLNSRHQGFDKDAPAACRLA